MNDLTKPEKIDFIQKIVKLHGLSMYRIAKQTGLTQSGIARIINGNTKNPHSNNVETIYKYLKELFKKDQDENPETSLEKLDAISEQYFAAMDARIKMIIERETGGKFKDVNETLLMLLKRSFDSQTEKGEIIGGESDLKKSN